jgi:acyl-CoA synthetase (AMP-forming)/AMP-acid ligase II
MSHPSVLEAAVVGAPDERWGGAGVAFAIRFKLRAPLWAGRARVV